MIVSKLSHGGNCQRTRRIYFWYVLEVSQGSPMIFVGDSSCFPRGFLAVSQRRPRSFLAVSQWGRRHGWSLENAIPGHDGGRAWDISKLVGLPARAFVCKRCALHIGGGS